MRIQKRNGKFEALSFDKVLRRIKNLANDKNLGVIKDVECDIVSQKVIREIVDGITSKQLDVLASDICTAMSADNPGYGELASRIAISNLHKSTPKKFSEAVKILLEEGVVNKDFAKVVEINSEILDENIVDSRDYLFDFFGISTLEKGYLLKVLKKDTKTIIERPQYMWMRVAVALHKDDLPKVFETYEHLSLKNFIHASPTLFNAGTKHQQLSSCFLLDTEDSVNGIFNTMGKIAQISKHGGGIGLTCSRIRAEGSIIRGTNNRSDGIMPMLKVYNEISRYVNQGQRKGSIAVFLEPHHADIEIFLEMKKNTGDVNLRARDLFYGLWVSDLFMKYVEADDDWYLMCPDECPGLVDAYGDAYEELYLSYIEKGMYRKKLKARKIWDQILVSQIETGLPYMCYKDAVNKKSNQENLGTISSSNLCVAPETMILTSKGYFKIDTLKDKEIEVWNGEKFSKTVVKQTGINQKLIKVNLSGGNMVECTPYHKFHIVTSERRTGDNVKIEVIEAKDLKQGMVLIKSNMPVIREGNDDFPYPYEHGLFCADGTYVNNIEEHSCPVNSFGKEFCKYHQKMYDFSDESLTYDFCNAIVRKRPVLFLYGEKKKLKEFCITRSPILEEKQKRITLTLPLNIKDKFQVPVNCNLDIKLKWFAGFVDGDGCICRSQNQTSIQVSSINFEFLKNVKYMLQTMGCDPKILVMSKAGFRKLPLNDGSNDSGDFYCQESYRLCLTSYDVAILNYLGFSPNRLKISGEYPRKNTKRWVYVENIEETGRFSDTYCFNEPERHMGIFNGVLTGNCVEIMLKHTDNEYAVCNISTISLGNCVKNGEFDFNLLGKLSKIATINLNKVIDINYYPTPETEKSNLDHRPIAVGIQGLYDAFIKLRIPFTSNEAKILNKKIFECIQYHCLQASCELAQKDGSYSSFEGSPSSKGIFQHNMWGIDEGKLNYDWESLRNDVKKYGLRNSMLTALPPTASTANILGNTSSFETITTNIFTRTITAGNFMIVNKYLVDDLKKLGLWSTDMKDQIISDNGSVQKINSIPDDLKLLYRTTWETSQKETITMSAERSPFIDQSQSLNIFMAIPTTAKLSSAHFHGWKLGCKTGSYYVRSLPSSTAEKITVSKKVEQQEALVCSLDNKESCTMCEG
jgi:ribonucleoside-diphosphate reductase alpha chain